MNLVEIRNRNQVTFFAFSQTQSPWLVLPVGVDLQDRFVKLGDLPVDEGLQGLFETMVVPLQLPLVLLLVWPDQTLVLP